MRCQSSVRLTVTLLGVIACAIGVSAPGERLCSNCEIQDVTLTVSGIPVRGTLVWPHQVRDPIPAVVVVHGYFANRAFMFHPWVDDLTRMGVATLLIDRFGSGESGGVLWRQALPPWKLDTLATEVVGAVNFLRADRRVDPSRIALLGHSDGGSAVLAAASADWGINATVSLSASVAHAEYVNHVAPQNLLLLYGAEDHFVLDSTDKVLIRRATRGVLSGVGSIGSFDDGTARKLVKVPSYGHVDVLFSAEARREALQWLSRSLRTSEPASTPLQPPRWRRVWLGTLGLFLIVVTLPPTRGLSASIPSREGPLRRLGWPAVELGCWCLGLRIASWGVAHVTEWQGPFESQVFVLLSVGPLVMFGPLTLLKKRLESFRFVACQSSGIGREVGVAFLTMFTVRCLLLEHYIVVVSNPRVVLMVLVAIVSFPTFWMVLIDPRPTWYGSAWSGIAFASVTAYVSPLWFPRVSMIPGFVLALVVLLIFVRRAVNPEIPPTQLASLGAIIFGYVAGATCVLR